MKKAWFTLFVLAFSLVAPAYGGDAIPEGSYRFQTFSVPGTASGASLQVEAVNNLGAIVGSDTSVTGSNSYVGYLRKPDGTLVTVSEPGSLLTEPIGVNDEGTVVGEYEHPDGTTHVQYSGFFYRNGNFTTYNFTDLPQYSATVITGINDLGSFCGFYQAAPAFVTVAYCNWFGFIDTNFPIPASTFTEPIAVNNLGDVGGLYIDSDGTDHGFIRGFDGKITHIDVPGAGPKGTALLGLNDFGWASGHYWDANNYEHGFVRSPDGKFSQIDAPGALTSTANEGTSGGGINDDGVVVGHYDPANPALGGVEQGYIATPTDYDLF